MASFLFSAASLLGLSGKNTISSRTRGITFALTCLAYTTIVTGADSPVVQLGRTSISGTLIDDDLDYFAGIPYAKAPVGSLRFEPPALKLRLDVDRFDATKRGPSCLSTWGDPNSMAEDCLTIDILRPAGSSPGSNLPVAVWFYGGGFSGGDNGPYGGNVLVRDSIARRTPIIYVTLNYRTNAFGFLCGKVAADNGASNVGLLDQKAALEWLHANIEFFGGDPGKVIGMGQSAGAVSLGIHALHGGLEGLVRAAVFMSGFAGTLPIKTPEQTQACFNTLVAGVPQCSNSKNPFECLRSVDAGVLLAAVDQASGAAPGGYAFIPTVDGKLLPKLPSKMNLGETLSNISILAGLVEDEGDDFAPDNNNCDEFLKELYTPSPNGPEALTSAIDQIEALYSEDRSLGSKKCSAIVGDLWFLAPTRDFRDRLAQKGRSSYAYVLDDDGSKSDDHRVHHGADIASWFGFEGGDEKRGRLAGQMRAYLLSYANSLDPNDGKGPPRPHWPAYTRDDKTSMRLNSKHLGGFLDKRREKQIKYLNEHPSTFGR